MHFLFTILLPLVAFGVDFAVRDLIAPLMRLLAYDLGAATNMN